MPFANPRRALRMTYVSQGNIPSRWAHTIQAMKMAEAFAQLVPDFRLIIQAHWTRWLRPRFAYEAWYGIGQRFKIVTLPSWRIPAEDLIVDYRHPAFDRAAARYARLIGTDLVFTRSPHAAKHCVERGLRVISEEHAPADYSEFKWIVEIARDPKFLALITISSELKHAYVQAGVPEAKIAIFSSGVDLRRFSTGQNRAEARRAVGLPDATVATYCGHLYQHKGVDRLIEAARRVPDIVVNFVGGWPDDVARCRALATDLPNVRFVGFVPNEEVPTHLLASDMVVLPNLAGSYDSQVTSPLKLYEYMASGRPIVASDIPALRAVLSHDVNAWLVEPGNSDSLADGLRYLRDHPEVRSRLSKQARADVQAYTWSSRAKAILQHVGALNAQ